MHRWNDEYAFRRKSAFSRLVRRNPAIALEMEMRSRTVSTGLWRWLHATGLERFEFVEAENQWIVRGTVLTLSSTAAEVRYEIVCDRQFCTRRARITLRNALGERTTEVVRENGHWHQDGAQVEKLGGAIDIDLGWSPSTNTLPIRRLGLAVGESSGPITAAWVQFPELKLQSLEQGYSRLDDRVYRYSSDGGRFQAKLLVDEHGIVEEYEGFWKRLRS